jgi:hypothetical protein
MLQISALYRAEEAAFPEIPFVKPSVIGCKVNAAATDLTTILNRLNAFRWF